MVWRQLPKLVPAGSIPVSCSKYRNILVENYKILLQFFVVFASFFNFYYFTPNLFPTNLTAINYFDSCFLYTQKEQRKSVAPFLLSLNFFLRPDVIIFLYPLRCMSISFSTCITNIFPFET